MKIDIDRFLGTLWRNCYIIANQPIRRSGTNLIATLLCQRSEVRLDKPVGDHRKAKQIQMSSDNSQGAPSASTRSQQVIGEHGLMLKSHVIIDIIKLY